MSAWTLWLDTIHQLLDVLSVNAGLGIVCMTIALRSVLLPLTWSIGYRACVRQKKMAKLKPALERIKEKYSADPRAYAEQTMALYGKNGIAPVDGRGLLGAIVQIPVFLGMFQTLKEAGAAARFLWIRDLSKPDVLLALLAGATTALLMAANPDLPESLRWFLIAVPSVLAVLAALKFCSALAVYWTVTNSFSAVQTAVLHRVVDKRIRSGALQI